MVATAMYSTLLCAVTILSETQNETQKCCKLLRYTFLTL